MKKIVGSEVTIFVYNAAGQMVAEYATTAPSSPLINYLSADTLGSPRINTDANGAVIARHDYMPYGEEIFTTGNRAAGIGYGSDDVRHKFTQKERDNESGLDYFGARYYSSAHGRLTSVDPVLVDSKRLVNPQRINAYAYSINNPLRYIDPDGADPKEPKKAKIEVKVEPYTVYGGSRTEARESGKRTGPCEGYEGCTSFTSKWEGKISVSAPVKTKAGFVATATGADLQLAATITIRMPEWSQKGSDSSPPPPGEGADDFNQSNQSLMVHEQGHVQYATAAINEIQQRVNSISVTATGKTPQAAQSNAAQNVNEQIKQTQDEVMGRLATANAGYDGVTEHGAHQERAPQKYELPKAQ